MSGRIAAPLLLLIGALSGCEGFATAVELPPGFLNGHAADLKDGPDFTGPWIAYPPPDTPSRQADKPTGTWTISERLDGTLTVSAVYFQKESDTHPMAVIAGTGRVFMAHGVRFVAFDGHMHAQPTSIDPIAPDPSWNVAPLSVSQVAKVETWGDDLRVILATADVAAWKSALTRHEVRYELKKDGRLVIGGPDDRLAKMLSEESDRLFGGGLRLVRPPKPAKDGSHREVAAQR